MARIVLATLNARYSHASFGLRYLLANLGELAEEAEILEFTMNDQTAEILSAVLAAQPEIVGFGVYIWNVDQTERIIRDLRRIAPQITVVLGGPEVSYETESQTITRYADFVICGEADLEFPRLCRAIFLGNRPHDRIIHAPTPKLDDLQMPYSLYNEEDISNRVIYVEASRGCPFTCEFCLSALDVPVRAFPLEAFLAEMNSLLERGVRQFKFVDRTFNLNLRISRKILEFFLDRYQPGLFLHFELIPDRLPESLREILQRFPAGALQFEIGIQSFHDEVSRLISRPQDNLAVEENIRFLRQETSVHLHTDLIAGLPGETFQTFAAGFDRLFRMQPQEIQVGILKRLRGTPIIRHDADWGMLYSESPPYEILSHRTFSFEDLQRVRLFARFWDLIGNSGNFPDTLERLTTNVDSPFFELLTLAEWIQVQEGRRHGISLVRLAELIFVFMTSVRTHAPQEVAEALWEDYTRSGRRDRPAFLRQFSLRAVDAPTSAARRSPERQQRHLGRKNDAEAT